MTTLPLPTEDEYWETEFWLCYQRYPGSGTNLRPVDVRAMPWRQVLWWRNQLYTAWEDEVDAINGRKRLE